MLLTPERRDLYLPLDECEIPTDARAKLEALGITTVEELKAYWFYDNRELLTQYLGDSPLNLVATKPPAGAVRGQAAKGAGRERERAGDRTGASPAAHAARGGAAAIAADEACG